jgi:multiple sugar transport system permease protein
MKRALLGMAALFAGLAPVYWLLTISLKHEVDQFAVPPKWLLFDPTLEHFRAAVASGSLERAALNSTIAALGSTLLALAAGIPAAYALARMPWPAGWSDRIGFWILSNRLLPPIVTVVPLFLMFRDSYLLNSIGALTVVYTVFHLPFVVWMMRGFFEEVPKEIEEAARLDGDASSGILWRIVLPLVRPGVAATAAFCMIAAWNEFLFALVLGQTSSAATLPVAISARVTQYEIKWGVMSAAGILAMTPVLAFAAVAQRYLVRGLSLGAVKG